MSPRTFSLRAIGALLVAGILMAAPVSAKAVGIRIAIWHMGTLGADRHTMRDTSPSIPSNDGTTTAIRVVNGWDGYGYRFNGTSSQVVVPDSDSLDPGSKPFSITTHVRFRTRPQTGVYDLITKGGATTRSYSVFISPKGKAVCSFHGSLRTASVHGASALNDRHWHTIVCAKASKRISITVDGVTTTSKVRVGGISNARSLLVGTGTGGGNKYRGVMDEVTIRVG
jgi:hypothetical protein